MRQNARPNSSISPRNPSFSSVKHKTFRYVPRSINQSKTRKISTESPPKAEEKKKRITQPKQPPPEPPIPSYLHKKKSDIQQTPRSKPLKHKEQLLRDPSCIALREHFFENGDFENYDDDKLKILLEHLREYSSYSALYREYDDAERADELQERIKEELQVRSTNISQEKNQDNNGEGRLNKELQKIQDELEGFDDQTNVKLEQLEIVLQEKIDIFEKKWRDEMPAKYRKPSTKLITIYDVERKLGLNKDFEKAKLVKAEAEQLEAIEMEKAQKQLNHDYSIARKKLDDKLNEERQQLIEVRNHRRAVLESRLKVVKSNLANRDTVVTMKQNESLRPKENIFDPTSRSPVAGGGAAINRRDYSFKSFNLLPPLLPPNDEKVREKSEKEIKEQRRKNKKFIMRIKEKEREADESDMSFSSKDDWDRDLDRLNNQNNNSALNTKRYSPKSRASTSLSKKRSEPSEKIEKEFNEFLFNQLSEKSNDKTSTTTIETGSKMNKTNNSLTFSDNFESNTSTLTKNDETESKSSKSNQLSSSISSHQNQDQNQTNLLDDLIADTTNKILNSDQVNSSISKDYSGNDGEQEKDQSTEKESIDQETFDDFSEDIDKTESEKKVENADENSSENDKESSSKNNSENEDKKDKINLDKSNDLSSLADILSFQSSTSNKNLDEDDSKNGKTQSYNELKNNSETFNLTQTKSFKADKNKKDKK